MTQIQISDSGLKTGAALHQTAPPPLLLTAKQASMLCSKSLRTWRTWDSAGLIPRPIRIGRSTLWRRGELCEWIAAGCPKRDVWEGRNGGTGNGKHA